MIENPQASNVKQEMLSFILHGLVFQLGFPQTGTGQDIPATPPFSKYRSQPKKQNELPFGYRLKNYHTFLFRFRIHKFLNSNLPCSNKETKLIKHRFFEKFKLEEKIITLAHTYNNGQNIVSIARNPEKNRRIFETL